MSRTVDNNQGSSMNLIGITFLGDTFPRGLPNFTFADLRSTNPLSQWRILVRGPRVLFVSAPGWDLRDNLRGKGNAVTVIEIPRSQVALHWGTEGEVVDVDKWTPPEPETKRRRVVEVVGGKAMSEEELEQATAPKVKR